MKALRVTRPLNLAMAGLLAVILLGLTLRASVNLQEGLWEDEIIATTHAVQPFWTLLVEVVRNDVHPHVYFAQLHFWSLLGNSDAWFMDNSLLWGTAAVGSMWAVLRRSDESNLALFAAAVLAVLPSAIWMSQDVRPYAWLSVLLIWAFYYADRSFGMVRRSRWDRPLLLLLSTAIVHTHAIGFVAVLCNGIYALWLLRCRHASFRDYGAWLAVHGLTGITALPVLVSNMLHDANLGTAVTTGEVLSWMSDVVTTHGRVGWVWATGLAAYLIAAGIGSALPRTRPVAVCFLIVPLVLAAAVGLVVKPLFKLNFFAALLAPFLALVLAQIALAAGETRRVTTAGVLLLGLLAIDLANWPLRYVPNPFRIASQTIRAEARPGDAVYAPQRSMFLGMAWYLGGPNWGQSLSISAPPSPQWQKVYALLGPELVKALGLLPVTQSVTLPDGLTLLVGAEAEPRAGQARRTWMITVPRADLPPGMPPDQLGDLRKAREDRFGNLRVTLYE